MKQKTFFPHRFLDVWHSCLTIHMDAILFLFCTLSRVSLLCFIRLLRLWYFELIKNNVHNGARITQEYTLNSQFWKSHSSWVKNTKLLLLFRTSNLPIEINIIQVYMYMCIKNVLVRYGCVKVLNSMWMRQHN